MSEPAGMWVPRDQRSFGGYELVAKLATGGMAEIFLARAANHDEPIVLKRILPHLADDDHFVQMFRDEASLAGQLVHPNICRVMHLGHEGSAWFIVMEHVHGVSLARMMTLLSKRNEQPDYRTVAGIMVQACAALHHAHEARGANGRHLGIVHRDVSPPNIMVTTLGVAKLLDFGIAKASTVQTQTRTGTLKGKNAYMSPEQILGRPLDRRSDIFALGAVLWELLSIRRLFQRDSDFMTYRAITEEPTPDIRSHRPDIPSAFRQVVERALAKDPAARFATAADMGRALEEAVQLLGGPATTHDLGSFMETRFAAEIARQDEILKAATVSTGERPALRMVRETGLRFGTDEGELAKLEAPGGALRRGTDQGWHGGAVDQAAQTLALEAVSVRQSRLPWLVIGALILVAAVWLVWPRSSDSVASAAPDAAVGQAVAKTPLDARRVATAGAAQAAARADATGGDTERDRIVALSKFGFLSLASDAPATVFVNGQRVGATPLQRVPLPPGVHKIKAVGPKKAVRQFDVTVYGGRDTEAPALTW